jgi:chromosome segregation ATPase
MEPVLTYEKVRAFCENKRERGEKVTIRSIVDNLGGSMGTASRLKKQWEKERVNINSVGKYEISQSLRDTILAEVGGVVSLRTEELEQRNRDLEEELEHLQVAIDRCEMHKAELKTKLEESHALVRETKNDYQAKNIALEQQASHLATSNSSLESKLNSCEQERIKLLQENANLKAQTQSLRENNADIKQELLAEREEKISLIRKLAKHGIE